MFDDDICLFELVLPFHKHTYTHILAHHNRPVSVSFSICFSFHSVHLNLHSRVLHYRAIYSDTLSTEKTNILHRVAGQEGNSRWVSTVPKPLGIPLLALDKHWGPFVLFWQPLRSSACWPRSRRRSSTHMTSIGNWLMAPTGPAIRPWQMCRPLHIPRHWPRLRTLWWQNQKRRPHGSQMSSSSSRQQPGPEPVQGQRPGPGPGPMPCPAIWSTVIRAVAVAAVVVSQVSKEA